MVSQRLPSRSPRQRFIYSHTSPQPCRAPALSPHRCRSERQRSCSRAAASAGGRHHAAPSREANLRYGHSETASPRTGPGRQANPSCGSHQPPPGRAAPRPTSSCPSAGPLPRRRVWQELLKAPSSRRGHSTGTELQLCHGHRAPCPAGCRSGSIPAAAQLRPDPPQSSSAVNPKTKAWQAAALGMREGYSAEGKGRCWSTADGSWQKRLFSGPAFKKKLVYHMKKAIQAVFKLTNAPPCRGREEGGINFSGSDDF